MNPNRDYVADVMRLVRAMGVASSYGEFEQIVPEYYAAHDLAVAAGQLRRLQAAMRRHYRSRQ